MQQPARRTASALAITLLCCTGLIMTLEGCASNSAPAAAPAAEAQTTVQAPPAPKPPMQKPLTADESDPNKMGWMQGFPPPPDRIIRFDLAGNMFPRTRYGFSHVREFVPTRAVWHGDGPVSKLPRAERDINGVLFTDPEGVRRTFAEALKLTYTDGILVMHKGKVVYERYFGALDAHTQHIAMSVTKSFVGTLAAMLVADGKLDPAAPVTQYVPELKDSAYSDATVRQVMDMTIGVRYSENYADPNADVWAYARAGGMLPRPAGYKGPDNFYDYLVTLKKEGEHDAAFSYKTVNAEVLAWIVRRASNKSLAALLSERIWQPMGAENDAYFGVDSIGTESGGGGLNTTLRDLARFGEMIRNDGRFNGRQILPKSVIDDIRRGGDPAKFAKAGYATLPGWSYRNMWWISNNAHHAFEARGIHGQAIYIDPEAQMTVVRYASHPIAANGANDPITLPAFAALADFLMHQK
ncbi:beta-lactamase family protein [Ralstonia insidiosa]|uniref:6-aminohexanoate hydrolase n=2 Tax=Ralstonia insidiosa TaxID=190721 RepID=A0A191ZW16_9RALS|nr:serine hydrolase [Ralstonia insidiosa]ANJ72350.1 6-aminohexanoate hydrolase [Ralstonia insidiosa]KAB0472897.1 serine hydrolase [Ralstonia insidiosa]MBY4907476.1 beta-lactamase family protein [Ralstonia insidiosa]